MASDSDGIELMQDLAPAQWVEERLWRWGNSYGTPFPQVGVVLPEGYAAYARVFHPAWVRDRNEPIRWATVASWTGRIVHPLMQFGRIANLPYPYKPQWGRPPIHGRLPSEECRTLATLLREFTSTPEHCFFCLWDGYGFIDPERYKNVPRVNAGREYLLFRGPVEMVVLFKDTVGEGQSPNIWWPEDRSWCVATEIDLFDTYVGGSEACIQRILNSPDLEALPTTIGARVDLGADTINA